MTTLQISRRGKAEGLPVKSEEIAASIKWENLDVAQSVNPEKKKPLNY